MLEGQIPSTLIAGSQRSMKQGASCLVKFMVAAVDANTRVQQTTWSRGTVMDEQVASLYTVLAPEKSGQCLAVFAQPKKARKRLKSILLAKNYRTSFRGFSFSIENLFFGRRHCQALKHFFPGPIHPDTLAPQDCECGQQRARWGAARPKF